MKYCENLDSDMINSISTPNPTPRIPQLCFLNFNGGYKLLTMSQQIDFFQENRSLFTGNSQMKQLKFMSKRSQNLHSKILPLIAFQTLATYEGI